MEILRRGQEATRKGVASGSVDIPAHWRCQDLGDTTKNIKDVEQSQSEPIRYKLRVKSGVKNRIRKWYDPLVIRRKKLFLCCRTSEVSTHLLCI